jgi:hypothetical protein
MASVIVVIVFFISSPIKNSFFGLDPLVLPFLLQAPCQSRATPPLTP